MKIGIRAPPPPYLADGWVPTVFDYQPGSTLFKQAITAAAQEWDGCVDNGVDPIMSTTEFQHRYPLGTDWSFTE